MRLKNLPEMAMVLGPWSISPQRLEKLCRRRLLRLLAHAYQHVPFYRSLWDRAGVRLDKIWGPEDLPRLPLVSKADLLRHPLDEVLAGGIDPRRCASSSSSGTSGEPLTVYLLPADRTAMNMGWFRAYLAHGLRPTDTMVAFVGRRQARTRRRWYETLGLFRRREISTWRPLEEWVAELETLRPRALTGYVMTLRLLAEHVRDHPGHDVAPQLVFHTSAFLDAASRTLFAEQFGGKVVDIYGSEEGGCIAWECPHCRGYHVNADLVLVEILRNGQPVSPGETGEVVVTNLHSFAMPIVRYRQGDVAAISPEPPGCGRPFPLLSRIEGRIEDFLVLQGGRRLPPHPFYHCIDPVPGVRRWRIRQREAGAIEVEIEAEEGLHETIRRAVMQELQALTRGLMRVELSFLHRLAVDPRQKFRSVASQVAGSTW